MEIKFIEINGSSAVSNEQSWIDEYPIHQVINLGLSAINRFEQLKYPLGLRIEHDSNNPKGNEILQYHEVSITLDY